MRKTVIVMTTDFAKTLSLGVTWGAHHESDFRVRKFWILSDDFFWPHSTAPRSGSMPFAWGGKRTAISFECAADKGTVAGHLITSCHKHLVLTVCMDYNWLVRRCWPRVIIIVDSMKTSLLSPNLIFTTPFLFASTSLILWSLSMFVLVIITDGFIKRNRKIQETKKWSARDIMSHRWLIARVCKIARASHAAFCRKPRLSSMCQQ